MAINQIFLNFFKSIKNNIGKNSQLFPKNLNYLLYIILIFSILVVFLSINHFMIEKRELESQNLGNIVESEEFKNLGNYLISKINSPYKEVEYVIQNNDSIEKILKKFKINTSDIKEISIGLKQKKLANIYSGRKLLLVLKKLEDGSNSVVNLLYPRSNTSNIEIRKN